jgi:membrane associated rhomboid family serine protease
MMAYSIYFNGGIESFTVNPMIGPSAVTLDKMGANNAARIRYNDEWWRFITPIFLHAGLVHLGFNVYVQYQIGTELEAMWGSTTWVVIFLLSGAGGNLASAIFLPTTIGVGASGSIMGMLGAWMLDLIIHWSDDDAENFLDPLDAVLSRKARKKTILMLVVNIIITMCLSIVPMVDWAAHVGGTVFGIILGAHFFGHDVIGACSKTATLIISLVMLIALTVWGFWYFYSVVDPCPDHVEGDPYTNYLPPTC